ncbi:hypothetical protein L1F34_000138 [Mammaliicoccus lentus]|uniref:NADPH-dependent F420 reductase n=1 Tax=Mammaliicoccus lentus TaxID=42858 RepID=UPI0039EBCF5F
MNIGIIGAGPIGVTISEKLYNLGHNIKIADVRSVSYLENKKFKGKAVEIDEVIKHVDILIISIPTQVIPTIKPYISNISDDVIVVDTSNYYPFRDGNIKELNDGTVESEWVSEAIGKPVIKAFNNLLAYTLKNKNSTEENEEKIAMAISGDNTEDKKIISELIQSIGFDTVDSGEIKNSWRHQPGTPAYCTELNTEELEIALKVADKNLAPINRDEVFKHFEPNMNHDQIIELNRKYYGTNEII